jgi:hypothetical protein
MSAKRRRFVDALGARRCQATIHLKDKSLAQCGRARVNGLYCTQHKKVMAKNAQTAQRLVREWRQKGGSA